MQERQAFPFLAITGISGISVSGNYWNSPLVFPFLAITGIPLLQFLAITGISASAISSISGNFDWPSFYCRKTSVNIIIRMKCGFFFDRY